MGLKATKADMTAALDKFGVDYSFPVYTSICDMTGIFSSKRNQHFGYAALSDNKSIIIADYNLMLIESLYEIPLLSIRSVKVSKMPIIGTYIVKLEFLYEGKKMRFDLAMPSKVIGSDFDEQGGNAEALINELKSYA